MSYIYTCIMIDFNFDINNIPDYAKAIGEAYEEAYEETHKDYDEV